MQTSRYFALAAYLTVAMLLVTSCAAGGAAPKPVATRPPENAPGAAAQAPAPSPSAPTPVPKATAAARYGGVLPVHVNGPTSNFDIHQESTAYVIQPLASAYNSLVKFDPLQPTEVVGDLAQRWEVSEAGKVYTFYLHQGVKWHDGQPLTAEDVRFSLDRIRKPPRGTVSPRQLALSSIKDIELVGNDGIKITLDNPHSAFLVMLSTGWEVIMPKHVIESKGSMKRDVVGTGPFKFVKHEPGVLLELKKNEDYFVKGRPYLDGLRFFALAEPTTRFAALRTKRILLTAPGNGVTPAQIEIIDREKLPIKVARTEASTLWRLVMRLDVPPWNDLRVRRAVGLAHDRQQAVRIMSEGSGTIGGPLPSNSPLAIPAQELAKMPGFRQPKDQDIAEAKKLLAEAGFPNGFDAQMIFRSGAVWEKAAVFFKDELGKIGIRATLEGMESGSFVNRLYEGRFVLAPFILGITIPEPGFMLGEYYLTGAGQNYGKFSDKEFDAMFEEQARTMDAGKRKEILLKMQYRVLEAVPFVLSHWRTDLGAMWPEVMNVKTGITIYSNHQHENTWLAQ